MSNIFFIGFVVIYIWIIQAVIASIINTKKGVYFPVHNFKKFLYLTFLPYVLYCLAIEKKPHQW